MKRSTLFRRALSLQKIWGNAFRWLGFMQSAPALATLLLGVGFLGGDLLVRYQVAHAPKPIGALVISSPAGGAITSVSGIVQTPNSEIVQVKYNRLVPEVVQGSLDDPQIRNLLMLGTKLADNNDVHATSVALLAGECIAGHSCDGELLRLHGRHPHRAARLAAHTTAAPPFACRPSRG